MKSGIAQPSHPWYSVPHPFLHHLCTGFCTASRSPVIVCFRHLQIVPRCHGRRVAQPSRHRLRCPSLVSLFAVQGVWTFSLRAPLWSADCVSAARTSPAVARLAHCVFGSAVGATAMGSPRRAVNCGAAVRRIDASGRSSSASQVAGSPASHTAIWRAAEMRVERDRLAVGACGRGKKRIKDALDAELLLFLLRI